MKKTIFIKNAIILTVSGLILRFIGVIFKVWLASKIGSEGIGLYQVIFSVFVFASTFATSGISTAITRLCADEIAKNNIKASKIIVRKGIIISLIIAFVSMFILLFGASFISESIISEKRATLGIKALSFSLPFMGICSCFRGYFIARRKATPPAVSQIIEQIIRIVVVLIAVKFTLKSGIEICCAGVIFGDTISEIISCLILYIVYKIDINRNKQQYTQEKPKYNIYKKISDIAIPITSGRYINSALRTTENILIPKFLSLYKKAKSSALSQFGMIKGMALPLLFFPSTLLNSLSTLLIPELSEAKTKNQKYIVSSIVNRTITLTAIVSYIFSAIFFVIGKEIGILIYKNEAVGYLVKILSPLVPLMYLDSISDGMLKGLDQQRFTFFTSIIDSSVRIVLLIFILPKYGLLGFIGIMYFSNIFTSFLNISKLIRVSKAKLEAFKVIFLPCLSAILSVLLVELVVRVAFYSLTSVYIILVSTLSIVVYFAILSKISCFSIKDYL